MKKIILNALKLIAFEIIVFIFSFILIEILCFNLINIFVGFKVIEADVGLYTSLFISGVFSLLIIIINVIVDCTLHSNKFFEFVYSHFAHIMLVYIFLIILTYGIKPTIIFSYETLKDLISLQWTIFAASLTIYVIWDNIVIKYLNEKRPKRSEDNCPIEFTKYIESKSSFYFHASNTFNTIFMLRANSISLIIATIVSYLVNEEVTLLNQALVIISFGFCTNTLISLLGDIIGISKEKQKQILKDSKVTKEEKDKAKALNIEISSVIKELSVINASNISDEEKEILKKEIVAHFLKNNEQ